MNDHVTRIFGEQLVKLTGFQFRCDIGDLGDERLDIIRSKLARIESVSPRIASRKIPTKPHS